MINIKLENYAEINSVMNDYLAVCKNARVPLTAIMLDWFQNNKQIFALKSPGKYADLSEGYKEWKQKTLGFIYPILRASGKLERSITDSRDENAIAEISDTMAIFGTSATTEKGAPYPAFLNDGTVNMPPRPMVFQDDAQTQRWLRIFVFSMMKQIRLNKGIR